MGWDWGAIRGGENPSTFSALTWPSRRTLLLLLMVEGLRRVSNGQKSGPWLTWFTLVASGLKRHRKMALHWKPGYLSAKLLGPFLEGFEPLQFAWVMQIHSSQENTITIALASQRMFCDCRKESCDCQSKHGVLGAFQKRCWLHWQAVRNPPLTFCGECPHGWTLRYFVSVLLMGT